VEENLARLWSDVLSIGQIGVHDTFFALGGHSLLATRLVARVCETFRLELPPHMLLQAATVAEMAVVVTQHLASATAPSQLEHLLQDVEKEMSR
jgi:acyl carrier protein